jgi:hypothetical protein
MLLIFGLLFSTYFPGMSGVGSEFMEFTRKIFYAKLIDNTSSERGFMEDINSGLNAVRKAIESEVAASTVKYSEEDTTLDAAVFNGNEAIKINISTRYWLLILILYLTTLLMYLTRI